MVTITGRIFDIHKISDKQSQIIIRKKNGDKIVPVAISIWGFWLEKALSNGLRSGDKIKAKVYLKSKFWDKGDRYLTDIYMKEVEIVERGNTIQFVSDQKRLNFDEETGEIFENK
jgi:hypothetical protein